MREKPDVPDVAIVSCLQDAYGFAPVALTFLPAGGDQNTAVYRVSSRDRGPLFLKLRFGIFDAVPIAVPQVLREQGMRQVIAAIETRDGQLWTRLDGATLMLYPYVEGGDGFQSPLTDNQWRELGAALHSLHTAVLPQALARQVARERFSPLWRGLVRNFQAYAERGDYADPISARLAAVIRSKRATIDELVERAEELAGRFATRAPEYVLCHADIHAGNVLIRPDGTLLIVDWDTLIFAPKERDLMFPGAGIGGIWNVPRESTLFYQGYGDVAVDPWLLAYYRIERIVEDIAAFGEELFFARARGMDRERGLRYFTEAFEPDNAVAIARATAAAIPAQRRAPN